jgi:hypothetical protein
VLLYSLIHKIYVVRCSETSVNYQTIRRHILRQDFEYVYDNTALKCAACRYYDILGFIRKSEISHAIYSVTDFNDTLNFILFWVYLTMLSVAQVIGP